MKPCCSSFQSPDSIYVQVKILARSTAGAVCILFTPVAITGLTGFAYRNATLSLGGKLVKEKRNPVELPQSVAIGMGTAS